MLKKHIRSHSDFRPYTCRHCNFAFKTKGNLTKHMKSKAHHKKCVEMGISPVPTTVEEDQTHSTVTKKLKYSTLSTFLNFLYLHNTNFFRTTSRPRAPFPATLIPTWTKMTMKTTTTSSSRTRRKTAQTSSSAPTGKRSSKRGRWWSTLASPTLPTSSWV